LSAQEVETIYNIQKDGFTTGQPPFKPNFTITAKNKINSSVIPDFSANINGVLYQSNNSEIVTEFLLNESFLANIYIYADGYFTRSYLGYTTNTNLNAILSPIGFLELEIKNQNTGNLITDLINITVQDGITEKKYNTSTGKVVISSLTENSLYNIFLKSQNYNNNQYSFNYNSFTPNPYIMFMNTDGEEIKFVVRDTNGELLANVDIIIEKFVDGNFSTISQKQTDISGIANFILDSGETHRVTISKSGFISKSFISQITETLYSVVLEIDRTFDYIGTVGGITYSFSPNERILQPNETQQFTFKIASEQNDLMFYSIQIYNGTNLIKVKSGNSPSGETITETLNTIPFNNSNIIVKYTFTRLNMTTYEIPVLYTILEYSTTDNILGLRQFMISNISLRDRIIIWIVIIVIFALVFSLGKNGYLTIMGLAIFSPMIGWFIGINLIILGVLSFIMVLAVISNNRGGGL